MNSPLAEALQPVEALRNDHRRATRLITLLTERLKGLARLSPVDIEIAGGVFRYIVDFVDKQHHAREDLLIEMIAKRSPEAGRMVRRTNKDHDELKNEGADILAVLASLADGSARVSRMLAERVRHYADELKQHFSYEESQLFDLAQEVLDKRDWGKFVRLETGSGDPMFGSEVEADFQSLFDIYINQIREIGTPASRHVAVSAAAFVDAAAGVASGTKSVYSAWRGGLSGIFKANIAGATALTKSRSVYEYCSNSLAWTRAVFGETDAMSVRMLDAAEFTARSAVTPFADALNSGQRAFDHSHRHDRASPSWQAQVVNLMLRATVKRIAQSRPGEEFAIPVNNIEIPRTAIDRFIPALAKDVDVQQLELENSLAEFLSIKGVAAERTILFFPGGGFMMAPTQAHRLMAARLARKANARVLLVHYRLAPEYRFPAGLDDCVEAYRYLLNEGTSPGSIAIIGDSAGGGMALSSLLRIRDAGLPMPAAAALLSPVTDLSYSGLSRSHNSWADPSLPSDERNLIAQVYLGSVAKDDPIASPLFGDLSGLPPILIQVGSIEILLDDALRAAAKIRAQGGDCDCEVWHDMPHDWMLFGMLPEARKAQRRIVEFFDEHFARQGLATMKTPGKARSKA